MGIAVDDLIGIGQVNIVEEGEIDRSRRFPSGPSLVWKAEHLVDLIAPMVITGLRAVIGS